jgi:DNA repair protein RadC
VGLWDSARVCDLPERLRPREELDRLGIEHVGDDVLLAVILRSGVRGLSVVEMSHHLLRKYGSFTAMARCSIDELASGRGMGRVKAQIIKAALEIARRLTQEAGQAASVVRTPEDIARFFRHDARTLDKEVFWVLMLDAKNKVKGVPLDITIGILDASLVHPREVFREAIRSAAAAVVLAHNHPSGDPTPSGEDIRITKQLVEAGTLVGIKVLDHVILGAAGSRGNRDFTSIREEGLVCFS